MNLSPVSAGGKDVCHYYGNSLKTFYEQDIAVYLEYAAHNIDVLNVNTI